MTTLKAFLFDLDGTLVDSRISNYLAYRDGFAAVGHDLSHDEFDRTWGRDSRDFIPELVPGISGADVAKVRRVKAASYARHLPLSSLNHELVLAARAMKHQVLVALVTTAKRTNVDDVLAAHDLGDLFDVIVTGDDVAVSKPDPAPYLLALARLGLLPDQAVAFEDSPAGVASATAAGVDVVVVEEFHG